MKTACLAALAVLLTLVGPAALWAKEGDVLFHDDFASLDREWGDEDERLRNEDHKLVLLPEPDRIANALLQHPFGDVDIRTTLSHADGVPTQSAGILFWGSPRDEYYVAQITSTGMFSILRRVSSRWLFPVGWRESDAIRQGLGQTNELRVVTQGDLATCYVNDRQVVAIRGFPPEERRQVGLHAESGNPPSRWEFSVFTVREAPPRATAPAPADGNVFLATDFAALDPAWGFPSVHQRVEGEKLVLEPPADTARIVMYQGCLFGDADIRVTVAASGDLPEGTMGLQFWATDHLNGYLVLVRPDGVFGASRWVNGRASDLAPWRVNPAVRRGTAQPNRLRVVTRGETATCFVNDRQVATFRGSPPDGGGLIGLYAASDRQPCRSEFSGVEVRRVPARGSESGASEPTVLFSDDFSVLDPRWGDGSRLRVSEKTLILQPPANGFQVASYGAQVTGDVDIRATVSHLEGEATPPAGIVFWGDPDAGAYYLAQVSPDGKFGIYRRMNDRWLSLSARRPSEVIRQGNRQTNELRVVTHGRSASFHVNGREVEAIQGYPPEGGRSVGLQAESGATPSTWAFSAFQVLRPPADDTAVLPASEPDLIFADDFATFDPAWGPSGDQLRVDNHRLVLQPTPSQYYVALYQGSLFADVDVRMKISPTDVASGQFAGVVFWGADYNSFYAACVRGNGTFAVRRRVNQRWLEPVAWRPSDALRKGAGQANELRVATQGRRATLWINGAQIVTIQGYPPGSGSLIGVIATSGETPTITEFSGFQVRKPPAEGSAAPGEADESLLLADDFSALDPAWGRPDETVNVDGGKLILTPKVGLSTMILYEGCLFDYADLRATFTHTEGEDEYPAGLAFWGTDAENAYVVGVRSDGAFGVYRRLPGKWVSTVAWRLSDAVKKGIGEANEVRVVTKGNTARIYVNRKEVTWFRGSPPSGGWQIGFWVAGGDEQGGRWECSSFSVRKVP